MGSNNLSVGLIEAGLLDEVRLMVRPVAIGRGNSLFSGLSQRLKARLAATQGISFRERFADPSKIVTVATEFAHHWDDDPTSDSLLNLQERACPLVQFSINHSTRRRKPLRLPYTHTRKR